MFRWWTLTKNTNKYPRGIPNKHIVTHHSKIKHIESAVNSDTVYLYTYISLVLKFTKWNNKNKKKKHTRYSIYLVYSRSKKGKSGSKIFINKCIRENMQWFCLYSQHQCDLH